MPNQTMLGPDLQQWKHDQGIGQASRQEKSQFIQGNLWRVQQYFVNQPQGDAPDIQRERITLAWDMQGIIALIVELEHEHVASSAEQLRMFNGP